MGIPAVSNEWLKGAITGTVMASVASVGVIGKHIAESSAECGSKLGAEFGYKARDMANMAVGEPPEGVAALQEQLEKLGAEYDKKVQVQCGKPSFFGLGE